MLFFRRLPIGIFLCAFLDITVASMVTIFLAKHLKKAHGLSHSSTGTIVSLYGFSQVPSSPAVTSLAVKYGSLRIFRLCMVLSGIFYLLLGFADNVIFIAVLRVLIGLTKHTQNLLKSELAYLTAEKSDRNESTRLFGFYQSMLSLGIVFGSTIGGYLMSYDGGYTIICTSTTIVYIIILGLTVTPLSPICKTHLSAEHKKHDDRNNSNNRSQSSSTDRDMTVIMLELLFLRFTLSITGHTWRASYVPLYTHMYDMDTIQIGQMVSYNAIVQLLVGFSIAYINKIFKTSYIQSMIALIVSSIVYILITLYVPLPILLVLILLLSSSTMLLKISTNQFSLYTLTHQQEHTTPSSLNESLTASNSHQGNVTSDNTNESEDNTTLNRAKSRERTPSKILEDQDKTTENISEENEDSTTLDSTLIEKNANIMTKFTGYAGSGDAIARLVTPIFVGFMLDYAGMFSVLYLNVCLIGVAVSILSWLQYNSGRRFKQKIN